MGPRAKKIDEVFMFCVVLRHTNRTSVFVECTSIFIKDVNDCIIIVRNRGNSADIISIELGADIYALTIDR